MPHQPELEELLLDIDRQLLETAGDVPFADAKSGAQREETIRYLLVGIGGLHLALAISDLAEVGPLPQITFLPNLPAWIQGIVNIRSEIISVVDLSAFLKLTDKSVSGGNRLVVLRYKKRKVGIRIDQIVTTVLRPLSSVKPLDSYNKAKVDTSLFAAGLLVENRFYYILNVPKFLTAPRLVNYNSSK